MSDTNELLKRAYACSFGRPLENPGSNELVRQCLKEGLLEDREGFLYPTKEGKAILSGLPECVPVEIMDFLGTTIPALPKQRLFDLEHEGDAALQWMKTRSWNDASAFYFVDAASGRTGIRISVPNKDLMTKEEAFALFPASTSEAEMHSHPFSCAVASSRYRLSRKETTGADISWLADASGAQNPENFLKADVASLQEQHASYEDLHRVTWMSHWAYYLLDFQNSMGFPKADFMTALETEGMDVYSAQCEDDPEEICLRADGEVDGVIWRGLNLFLLAPWWDESAPVCQGLVDSISDNWSELQKIRKEMLLEKECVAAAPSM